MYASCLLYIMRIRDLCQKMKINVGFPCHNKRSMILGLPHTRNVSAWPFNSILKAINGPIPSYGKRRKNSTLRAKLLWMNYILYIESTSLCPLSLNTVFSPPSSSLIDGEPHCLPSMSLPLVEDWSGGGLAWRNLVSQFQTMLTQKFVTHSLLLIIS